LLLDDTFQVLDDAPVRAMMVASRRVETTAFEFI
jgi:hypothetical protein